LYIVINMRMSAPSALVNLNELEYNVARDIAVKLELEIAERMGLEGPKKRAAMTSGINHRLQDHPAVKQKEKEDRKRDDDLKRARMREANQNRRAEKRLHEACLEAKCMRPPLMERQTTGDSVGGTWQELSHTPPKLTRSSSDDVRSAKRQRRS
jgi:hypothetical protein